MDNLRTLLFILSIAKLVPCGYCLRCEIVCVYDNDTGCSDELIPRLLPKAMCHLEGGHCVWVKDKNFEKKFCVQYPALIYCTSGNTTPSRYGLRLMSCDNLGSRLEVWIFPILFSLILLVWNLV